jgi:superfamily I DNA/RNA helicase
MMVDEYQDTNDLQFQLIRHLTKTHQNLCVVGDDDQSIYGFRGADVGHILQFEKFFSNTTIIKLEQNYRSTTNILQLANEVIKKNYNRYNKTLWTAKEEGSIPQFWVLDHPDHEAECVALEIKNLMAKNIPLSQMAILYRSNNQTQELEESFGLHQIPYKIIGGQKFYEKKEIKDLTAYLGLIHNTRDELSLRRVLNTPQRGIGQKTLEHYLQLSQRYHMPLFECLASYPHTDSHRGAAIEQFAKLILELREERMKPLKTLLEILIEKTQFYDHITKSYPQLGQQIRRKQDVEFFIRFAEKFQAYVSSPQDSLKLFLEKIFLEDSQDKNQDLHQQENQVTLMTFHSSKGLEFDYVFMIGVEEDILPHKNSLQSEEKELDNIEEERRLCYVGITRARKQLYITRSKHRTLYGKQVPRLKSRFFLGTEKFYQEFPNGPLAQLNVEEKQQIQNHYFDQISMLLGKQ